MKRATLIFASVLSLTACGKKRAECKSLVAEFNTSVTALNEAKKDLSNEPKDLIISLDAHIKAAETLVEALDGMEVSTEELLPIVEEAKTAARAKAEASKRVRASMETLDTVISDAEGVKGTSFKEAFSELQTICADDVGTELGPCAELVTLVSSYTKAMSSRDLEEVDKIVDKIVALNFGGDAARKARDAVAKTMRAPVDVTKSANSATEATATAQEEFRQAKEKFSATAASISEACG